MSSQQIIPAITVDQVGGFAVDTDIDSFIAFHALSGLGIKFHQTDIAEIGSIAQPQTTRSGIEQQSGVDGITVFIAIRGSHLNGV